MQISVQSADGSLQGGVQQDAREKPKEEPRIAADVRGSDERRQPGRGPDGDQAAGRGRARLDRGHRVGRRQARPLGPGDVPQGLQQEQAVPQQNDRGGARPSRGHRALRRRLLAQLRAQPLPPPRALLKVQTQPRAAGQDQGQGQRRLIFRRISKFEIKIKLI